MPRVSAVLDTNVLVSAFLKPMGREASSRVTHDPDDDMVVACAAAGGANYLVTGNLRHFPGEFEGIKIIPPRQFLVILAAEAE